MRRPDNSPSLPPTHSITVSIINPSYGCLLTASKETALPRSHPPRQPNPHSGVRGILRAPSPAGSFLGGFRTPATAVCRADVAGRHPKPSTKTDLTALISGLASAQTGTTKTDATNASTTMHTEGEWRASKLVGVNVYNEANEKIGDVNEVILDKSGKVANVILGVGGFVGMGEHYVAVAFDKLKWVNEPARPTTASTSTAPASTPATNVDNNARTASDGTARTT